MATSRADLGLTFWHWDNHYYTENVRRALFPRLPPPPKSYGTPPTFGLHFRSVTRAQLSGNNRSVILAIICVPSSCAIYFFHLTVTTNRDLIGPIHWNLSAIPRP